jgi:DNA-binding transcriptional MocR family regulator
MDVDAEPVSVDDHGVRREALAQAISAGCQAAIYVPRAQSPTGAAWDARRARELASVLAGAPELLVIEDDHAAEVAGATARTVTAGRQKWAVVRSVSKSLGPDLHLAIGAGDPVTIARVEGRQASYPDRDRDTDCRRGEPAGRGPVCGAAGPAAPE